MSAYDPPTYSVTPYNPSYFTTSSGSGLTLSQASGIFLTKSSPDTATALETFTAGIATNSIAPAASATNMTISSSSNTGAIIIDTGKTGSTNADPAIAIGTSSTAKVIKIGSGGADNSMHIGSLDIAGTSINNISGTSGAIVIGNLQTDNSATISIGGNASRTGNIAIGQTTSQFTTTIGSSNASALVNLRNPILNYSYTTVPNYSIDQTGSTFFYVLNNLNGNAATLGSDSPAIVSSASIGVGVYYISYSLRIAATSTTVPSSVTAIKTYINIGNQSVTATTPAIYGESSQLYSQTAPVFGTAVAALFPTINGSAIVRIITAGLVSVRYLINAGTGVSFWNENTGVRQPYNYLSVVRIA